MPHPPMQPMAGSPPNGPANAGKPPTNIMQELNLTEEQKQKMTDWRKLQQQHMQDTLGIQEKLEELASTDKPDNTAIKALAEKSGHDTEQYYLDYAEKNHAFIASLTPEQRKKMKEFQQQRKEQMQQMRDRMKQQMNATQKPAGTPPAAASTPAPAATKP
ncbi:MAG TPA: Spy/CpxP family protein refolding chaperone [Pseudomonadales bacterium]|nr:Spy/CpxP family protein refolding chaperone [Pseudomonadales bacterium]